VEVLPNGGIVTEMLRDENSSVLVIKEINKQEKIWEIGQRQAIGAEIQRYGDGKL